MDKTAVILHFLRNTKGQYPHVLETRFPHVLKNMLARWDSPDFPAYVADLLQTTGRSGGRMDRNGFPKDAWDEIFRLAEFHKTTHMKKGGR